MKLFFVCLALGVGLLSGCSDSQTVQTAAGLAGTYDVARAGQYLFVTSSDRDELRVLDLAASPRDWVRAPNPLESLAIPVLERPSNLTRDVTYEVLSTDADGNPIPPRVNEGPSGPYVYARSFGSKEISVVVADTAYPEYFRELTRLQTPGLVTAFAARGPEGARRQSVLYFAVQRGADAELYSVNLPAPDQFTSVPAPVLKTTLPDATVTALLPLPAPLGQEAQDPQPLVVSTRSTVAKGGEAFRMDANAPQTPRVLYKFGAAVRLLATHPRAEIAPAQGEEPGEWRKCQFDPDDGVNADGIPLPPAPLVAGQYVFGVLDEHSCGAAQQCSGVLAVDAVTGELAKDPTGLPMLPISQGDALPTGLTLAAGAEVRVNCTFQSLSVPAPTAADPSARKEILAGGTQTVVKRLLVGILTSSNGQITYFDAARMRQFDLDGATAGASVSLVDSLGATKISDGTDSGARELAEHLNIEVLEGVTRNDTYRLVYQLTIPGLADLNRSNDRCPEASKETCFEVEAGAATAVQIGDIVVLRGDAGSCKDAGGAEVDFVVTQKVESAGLPTLLLTERPRFIPPECADLPRISVRAGAFLVLGDTRGLLGRLTAGQQLAVAGTYFFHPPSGLRPDPKEIILTVKKLATQVARGDQYIVNTLSHYLPFIFAVENGGLGSSLSAYRLPGPVVYTQVGEADFAYIAYPSADGILQVSLEAIVDNTANARGLVPFE